MNIFILDRTPEACARAHTDVHVRKMLLESAQILCSAHYRSRQLMTESLEQISKTVPRTPENQHRFMMAQGLDVQMESFDQPPYLATHLNHPCVGWAAETHANYYWLVELGYQLHTEMQYRWPESTHKSFEVIKWADTHPLDYPTSIFHHRKIPLNLTTPAACYPPEYRLKGVSIVDAWGDIQMAYQNYYKKEKITKSAYTNRTKPEWS